MIVIYTFALVLLNLFALFIYRKLTHLSSLSQIEAEVELEMQSRAHHLLVQRDKLEVGLVKDELEQADEKWKEDLAQYMEEFEQEALLRAKKRFKRFS